MKKIVSVLSALALSFAMLPLGACKDKDEFAEYRKPEGFSYYRAMTMNSEKKLYVFNRSEKLTPAQIITAQAIQGIYARTDAKYYFWSGGNYTIWLEDMTENYGFTAEDITYAEMVEAFKSDYGNKYVLYDGAGNAESLNSACTIAGAMDYLPVDISSKDEAKSLGLEMAEDATKMTEAKCFAKYKDKLNNDGIVQIGNENFNDKMRDYGIACKYLFTWPKNMSDPEIMKFRAEALQWAKEDSPIYGWCPNDETIDVAISSNNSMFTLASDHCTNMSVFTCKSAFGDLEFKQKNKTSDVVAEDGKHYVCIMMSDGDNVQTWYNNFATNPDFLAAERGDFPMGWSMQPSLCDLAPNIMNYVYSRQDKNDYYVCSVSGHGYINPQNYPALNSFIGGLEAYLQYADLSVVQILDSGPSKKVTETYAKVPSLKGGIYCYGDKYVGGAGSVYWSNDKPFVAIRETLWNASVESMARRINNYDKDPTTIKGYTAINLHPWSMTYADVKQLVSLLSDDVVVVTADDFIRLITDNVPHEDVTLPYTNFS